MTKLELPFLWTGDFTTRVTLEVIVMMEEKIEAIIMSILDEATV